MTSRAHSFFSKICFETVHSQVLLGDSLNEHMYHKLEEREYDWVSTWSPYYGLRHLSMSPINGSGYGFLEGLGVIVDYSQPDQLSPR